MTHDRLSMPWCIGQTSMSFVLYSRYFSSGFSTQRSILGVAFSLPNFKIVQFSLHLYIQCCDWPGRECLSLNTGVVRWCWCHMLLCLFCGHFLQLCPSTSAVLVDDEEQNKRKGDDISPTSTLPTIAQNGHWSLTFMTPIHLLMIILTLYFYTP